MTIPESDDAFTLFPLDPVPAKTRAPTFFVIPSGATPAQCTSCHKTVYWIRTTSGARMPVDCAIDGGVKPFAGATARERQQHGLADDEMMPADGRGVAHFVTCPYADDHRRPRT